MFVALYIALGDQLSGRVNFNKLSQFSSLVRWLRAFGILPCVYRLIKSPSLQAIVYQRQNQFIEVVEVILQGEG